MTALIVKVSVCSKGHHKMARLTMCKFPRSPAQSLHPSSSQTRSSSPNISLHAKAHGWISARRSFTRCQHINMINVCRQNSLDHTATTFTAIQWVLSDQPPASTIAPTKPENPGIDAEGTNPVTGPVAEMFGTINT